MVKLGVDLRCFFTFGLSGVTKVTRGMLPLLHCAKIAARIRRRSLLGPGLPPKPVLLKALAHDDHAGQAGTVVPLAVAGPVQTPRTWHGCVHDAFSVEYMFKAINATRNLKIPAALPQTAGDIMSLMFDKGAADTLHQQFIDSGRRFPEGTSIRRGRARLDLAACALERRRNHALLDASPGAARYLQADASPQGGVDAFCARVDIMPGGDPGTLTGRLPFVTLGHGHASFVDKAMALLQMVFLAAGPGEKTVREYLLSIRGITIDFGVESGLADVQDCLTEFLAAATVAKGGSSTAMSTRCLSPLAVQIPRWNHMCLYTMCASLGWFPAWLADLKLIVRFMRNKSYRQVFRWRVAGEHLAAGLVSFACNIAHWRWGTLVHCMKAVLACREATQKYFSAAGFVAQDSVAVSAVAKAKDDASFWRQLLCVHWFAQRSEHSRSWGMGCPCHGEESLQGKQPLCVLKPRRLTELPYVIAGAEDPIVARRCVQLYDAQVKNPALEPWVHRAAHHYFSPSSALGAASRQHAGGGSMSDLSARELTMLSMVPLTEQPAEALHRDISRVFQVAAHAQVPWAAGTLRLEQNIADVEAAAGGDKNEESHGAWYRWKSLIKSGSRHVAEVRQPQRASRTQYI